MTTQLTVGSGGVLVDVDFEVVVEGRGAWEGLLAVEAGSLGGGKTPITRSPKRDRATESK
jgi:hypothetical protein